MDLFIVLAVLGGLTGVLSGLLGIGGGIVMAPLLLFGPPLFGLEALDMRTVAGLTIVQSLVGGVAGGLAHRRFDFVSKRLVWVMGVSIFIAAALGGVGSAWLSSAVLLVVFSTLAMAAALLMMGGDPADPDAPVAADLRFSTPRAIAAAALVGGLGGMVGQGGSFLLIPMMTRFVGVPTRIAISSNLVIVAASSLAGMMAKAATGQIEWWLTIPIVLTVIPAARLGSAISRRTPVRVLRRALAMLILAAAIHGWSQAMAQW